MRDLRGSNVRRSRLILHMELYKKNVNVDLCGMVLRFEAEEPLLVPENVRHFMTENKADQIIRVRIGQRKVPQKHLGSGMITDYGERNGLCVLSAQMPWDQYTTFVTEYMSDLSQITIWLNTLDYTPCTLLRTDKLLQYLPMRDLMLEYGSLLLHSSRIEVDGKAILFTAASGGGKTTQARLWEQQRHARIVSNDRSVIRLTDGGIMSSGYPADGSTPICSPEQIPLGAIVILRQGRENRAEPLSAGAALRELMSQTAADSWNGSQRTKLMLLWADILEKCPAFLLSCRPDEGSVCCLNEELEKWGETHGHDS